MLTKRWFLEMKGFKSRTETDASLEKKSVAKNNSAPYTDLAMMSFLANFVKLVAWVPDLSHHAPPSRDDRGLEPRL